MPRRARIVIPGCPHHIVNRGNHKEKIFHDDGDRLVYLRLMRNACAKYGTHIWAYVLMDNHVHHVAVPDHENSLAKTMKQCHGDYAAYFNLKYNFVGHAWQERFKSFPMDLTYCMNAIRYVERNPVRAGIVDQAERYRWSSAAAHCGLRDDLLLSDQCPLVAVIDHWSSWLAQSADCSAEHLIREHTSTGRPLGSKSFIVRVGNQNARSTNSGTGA